MTDQSFDEVLHGLFYDVIRSAGVSLTGDQLAKVRVQTGRLALAIEKQAEQKAIEVARRLQVAVADGFKAIAEDVVKVEKAVKELDDNSATVLTHLLEAFSSLEDNIEPSAKIDPFKEHLPDGIGDRRSD